MASRCPRREASLSQRVVRWDRGLAFLGGPRLRRLLQVDIDRGVSADDDVWSAIAVEIIDLDVLDVFGLANVMPLRESSSLFKAYWMRPTTLKNVS